MQSMRSDLMELKGLPFFYSWGRRARKGVCFSQLVFGWRAECPLFTLHLDI
jgi:hypothetical protein